MHSAGNRIGKILYTIELYPRELVVLTHYKRYTILVIQYETPTKLL